MMDEAVLPLYEIRETTSKGQAIFANIKIARGQRILEEVPALLYPGGFRSVNYDQLYTKFLALPQEKRVQILQLHATQYFVDLISAIVSNEMTLDAQQDAIKLTAAFQSNKINISNRFDGKDNGTDALCPTIAKINHSCQPNVVYAYNLSTKTMTVHALRDIQPNEEITMTYLGNLFLPTEARQKNLEQYEFKCDCSACDLTNTASQQRRHIISCLSQDLQFFQIKSSLEDSQVSEPLPESMFGMSGDPDPLPAITKLEKLYIKEGMTGFELSGLYYYAGIYHDDMDADDMNTSLKYLRKALEVDTLNQGEDHPDTQDLKRLVSLLELRQKV